MGSFQIVPVGNTSLKIVDPPVYWVVTMFVLPFLVCILAFNGSIMAKLRPSDRVVSLHQERRTVRQLGRGWALPAVSALLSGALGYVIWCLLQTSTLTLDRQSASYTLNQGRAFFTPSVTTGSLTDIDNAVLETGDGAVRFVLVMQDGKRISLGGYSDQGRQSEAVTAVNRFLQNGAE